MADRSSDLVPPPCPFLPLFLTYAGGNSPDRLLAILNLCSIPPSGKTAKFSSLFFIILIKFKSQLLEPLFYYILGTLQIHNFCITHLTSQDSKFTPWVSGGVGLSPKVCLHLILELVFLPLDTITFYSFSAF